MRRDHRLLLSAGGVATRRAAGRPRPGPHHADLTSHTRPHARGALDYATAILPTAMSNRKPCVAPQQSNAPGNMNTCTMIRSATD